MKDPLRAAARAGMNIAVITPPQYQPGTDSSTFAVRETALHARRMLVSHGPAEAVKGADAVLVFQQAANRLPATQPVLDALLTSRLAGR